MKKFIKVLLFVVPFIFFSCASDEVPADEVSEDLAPLTEESVTPEDLDTENNTQETTQTEVPEDYLHQNLEEIDEPEVITLDPEEDEVEDVFESEQLVIVDTEDYISEDDFESTDTEITDEVISSSEETPLLTENTDIPSDITETEDIETIASEDEKDISVNIDELENTVSQENQTIEITDNVIEITDEEPSQTEEEQTPELEIVPSRSVTIKRSEYLDILYPGNGWIYMGITDNSKDIAYFGRKVGTQNTKFSVQARNAGTKILHFYKNDPISGAFIDDYLEVIVLEEKGSNKTHIEAPEYKAPVLKPSPKKNTAVEKSQETEEQLPLTEKETKTEQKTEPVTTQKQTSAQTPKQIPVSKTTSQKTVQEQIVETEEKTTEATEINPEDLLSNAKTQLKEKSYVQAYNNIIKFLDCGTTHLDEALFIKGQILEAKSDIQNINEAIKTYTTLTKNYPASKYWDDANKRIIYLKRFYLEGR